MDVAFAEYCLRDNNCLQFVSLLCYLFCVSICVNREKDLTARTVVCQVIYEIASLIRIVDDDVFPS